MFSRRMMVASGLAVAAAGAWRSQAVAAVDPSQLLDPELRELGAEMSAHPMPVLNDANVALLRRPPAQAPRPMASPPITEQQIPGRADAPPVKVLVTGRKAGGPPRPAVLNIHGGGFVSGTAAIDAFECQLLATEMDCVVVSVDYRLAPETPFPGSLEDNYAALKWLHDNADELGVDRRRIAIKGGSAGGGHAAMLAIAARDRGEVPVCCQILIYPMLDDRTGSTRQPPAHIGTYVWTAVNNRYGWSALLGAPAGSAAPPPGSVPARERDLSRLPPTFVGVGALDLFVDEDIAYAQRLADAGVPVELLVVPGAIHGFDVFAPKTRIAQQFKSAWQSVLRAGFIRGA